MKLSIMVRVQSNSVLFEFSEPVSSFVLDPDEAIAFSNSIAHAASMSKLLPTSYEDCKQAVKEADAEAICLASCSMCGCDTNGGVEDTEGNSTPLCFECYEKSSLQIWRDFVEQIKKNDPNAPMVALSSEFPVSEAPANGLVCSICGEPQFITPGGVFCVNLHEDRGVFS